MFGKYSYADTFLSNDLSNVIPYIQIRIDVLCRVNCIVYIFIKLMKIIIKGNNDTFGGERCN